jgi:hypothetical protein
MTTTRTTSADISDATLRAIVADTLANGGHTVSTTTGNVPKRGWLVALPANENIVAEDLFDIGTLRVYIDKFADDLDVADNYLGTWVDAGKVYVDTSIRIDDDAAAEATGRKFNQLAIYNVATGETRELS